MGESNRKAIGNNNGIELYQDPKTKIWWIETKPKSNLFTSAKDYNTMHPIYTKRAAQNVNMK